MSRLIKSFAIPALIGAVLAPAIAAPAAADGEVNLYSYRQPFLIEPLLDRFSKETGIKVNIVFADKGMLERIKAAGTTNPADAVLTVDIGRLNELVEGDVLQPFKSDTVSANIPDHLRGTDNIWVALTTRARIAMVSKERVKDGELKTYEDLADPRFKDRICIRSGKNSYNVALIASMIAHHGEEKAKTWLEGFKANLARKPQGNDRAQAKAVYEGVCDIAIANTYYMGAMMTNDKAPEQKKWADAVRIEFLNQGGSDRGAHVNVSGAGLLKGAKNEAEAIKLIEWLTGNEAQHIYAEVNHEYPANPAVAPSDLVKSWGQFKADDLDMETVAKFRERATRLVDEVNFDEGPTS